MAALDLNPLLYSKGLSVEDLDKIRDGIQKNNEEILEAWRTNEYATEEPSPEAYKVLY